MMLYIAPEVVRLDRAISELAADRVGGLTRSSNGPGVYSATGAWGIPLWLPGKKVGIVVEAMVQEIVKAIEAL